MTQKDKIEAIFLENPAKLHHSKIYTLLLSRGFHAEDAKWSHYKMVHTESGDHTSVPLHNNDCRDTYKRLLQKFYISHLPQNAPPRK